MINIDTSTWKEFKVGDIFRLEPTKGKISTDLEFGKDIPYIAAKRANNGFEKMCKLDGFEDWVSKGNCIVFVQIGEGSTGYVNYIDTDFIGMQGKTTCGYIDGILNKYIGMFLTTILCMNKPKYSFGRSWTGERLVNTIMKLPATKSGEPDWNFMEQYIKSLWGGSHNTSVKYSNININIDLWKEFRIGDIFELKKCKCGSASDLEEGNETLYIGAKKSNNGVMKKCKINKKLMSKGNCIIFICDGEGSVGYCNYCDVDFIGSTTLTCGYNEHLNKYVGMFLVSILDLEKVRYSYGRKYSPTLASTIIKLPSTECGEPDYLYMENYIKQLQYSDMI